MEERKCALCVERWPCPSGKGSAVQWLKWCALLCPSAHGRGEEEGRASRGERGKEAEGGVSVRVQNSLSSAAVTLATCRWTGMVWRPSGIRVYKC